MRLDDLTYNNWVLVENGNGLEPHQIKGIVEDEAIIDNGETIPKECMSPLPITDEILRLNHINYNSTGRCYNFVFNNEVANRFCVIDGLRYVHELQNSMKAVELLNCANEFKIK